MFLGSAVALITPFDEENQIDILSLQNLIEWHIEEKTDALVVCGTTPTLSDEEKDIVIETAIKTAKGRIPIIAGTGCYDTKKTIEATQKALSKGVDACLVIVPYYNRPTPKGVVEHFKKVAALGLPTIVYHHPVRTGTTLTLSTLIELSQIPHVVGIKEASGKVDLCLNLSAYTYVYAGDDQLTIPMMATGAKGVISIVANLFPKENKHLTQLCLQNRFSEALEIARTFSRLNEALVSEPNPQCVKYALHLMGKCLPHLRLPLLMPEEKTQETLKNALDDLHVFSESL